MNKHIAISDYQYELPDEKIARFPVEPRDSSKLLVAIGESVETASFSGISEYLDDQSFLVFNNTKVIPARLYFKKSTGAYIELFLLHPVLPSPVIAQAMEATGTAEWICMIGNKKKWKGEILAAVFSIGDESVELTAELTDHEKNQVKLTWKSPDNPGKEIYFSTLVRSFGEIPLPPYLNRETEEKDLETYQTIYSLHDGAVAAPTAGLHFTDEVLSKIKARGIGSGFVTLHVGAGTFQPVKVENAVEHTMHSEQMIFSLGFIEALKSNLSCVLPVGTTSMRSLESLYWFGVKLFLKEGQQFFIEKLYAYQHEKDTLPSAEESLEAIISFMKAGNLDQLHGETEIFIFPGYEFRICRGIITNFHQPGSTLLLLIAALIGEERWKELYAYALENDFRFLSYGDSSLLIPSK